VLLRRTRLTHPIIADCKRSFGADGGSEYRLRPQGGQRSAPVGHVNIFKLKYPSLPSGFPFFFSCPLLFFRNKI
jgi:hypothetical protein